jgi:hypothetical protein
VEIPAHSTPAGPLAVRWVAHELSPFLAGRISAATIELENAGTAPWVTMRGAGVFLAYHWLDLRGNPIVWADQFIPLPRQVAPGERLPVDCSVRAPIPPGRYRLAFDLVDEGRYWFVELGNERLELDVEVESRLAERTLAVRIGDGDPDLVEDTEAALAELDERVVDEGAATAFLIPGCRPAPDWSRLILDAHEEGFAAVAGSIEVQGRLTGRRFSALTPWQPGFGRSPAWDEPLLCPSLVSELVDEAEWTEAVAGLPALDPQTLTEPWLCDGRIRVAVDARALRRAGRPRA